MSQENREPARRRRTHDEWLKEGENRFGADRREWKFKCPQCGGIQSAQDFIDAGVESPESKFYFSCIGRWVDGRGCDWTLGGLFQIHEAEVITNDGEICPVFEFAETEGSGQ